MVGMTASHDLRDLDPLAEPQRDILCRIAAGRTNPEIAQERGITLDGVKWHVREIPSKLGVDSRDAAVGWWRSEHRPVRRARRLARRVAAWPLATLGAKATVGLAAASVTAIAITVAVVATSADPHRPRRPAPRRQRWQRASPRSARFASPRSATCWP